MRGVVYFPSYHGSTGCCEEQYHCTVSPGPFKSVGCVFIRVQGSGFAAALLCSVLPVASQKPMSEAEVDSEVSDDRHSPSNNSMPEQLSETLSDACSRLLKGIAALQVILHAHARFFVVHRLITAII